MMFSILDPLVGPKSSSPLVPKRSCIGDNFVSGVPSTSRRAQSDTQITLITSRF